MYARVVLWCFSFVLVIFTICYSNGCGSTPNTTDVSSTLKRLPAITVRDREDYVEPDHCELEREHKRRMRTLDAFDGPFTINDGTLLNDCDYYPHECMDGIRVPRVNCIDDPDYCREAVDRVKGAEACKRYFDELRRFAQTYKHLAEHTDQFWQVHRDYREAFPDTCIDHNNDNDTDSASPPFVKYDASAFRYQWTQLHNQCKTFQPVIDRRIEYDPTVRRLFMFYRGEFTQCDSFRHIYYWKHAELLDNRCRPLMWHALGYNDLEDATRVYVHAAYTEYVRGGAWGPELVAMGSGKLLINHLEYDLHGKRPSHLVSLWDRTPLYKPHSRYSTPTSVARDLHVSLKGFTDELRRTTLTGDRATFWIKDTTIFVGPFRIEYTCNSGDGIIWAPMKRGTNWTT
jgi:hypothetical protein